MLFNSLSFAIFLPIVFFAYWALPHRYRWVLVLAASYYFYMSWNVKYVVLILFTTVISYGAARLLDGETRRGRKKAILATAAVLCLGVLFFFKYFNFFSRSVTDFAQLFAIRLHPVTLNLLLPVGISFYTFQTLSYVIDVYKGDLPAEKHFGYYAAFVSFFPQLVAGPIERTSNLLPQIRAEHRFDYDQASYGLKLMAWGFFKKIVIADTLSQYVSLVFDNPRIHVGFALLLGALFFTVQIYCDFSGYSDIAIGTARLFGIHLMTNFRSPYFAQSIKEFWSRWHISLSTWFRDYVYIPLGGNRVGKLRRAWNLIATFLVSGLWHGADWTFVLWGGLHGIGQVAETMAVPKNRLKRATGIPGAVRTVLVFLFAVFTWIFFVSHSIGDAFYVLGHLFIGISSPISYIRAGLENIGLMQLDILLLGANCLLLAAFDWASLKLDVIASLSKQKTALRWTIYILFVLWMVLNLPANNSAEFIYFQF